MYEKQEGVKSDKPSKYRTINIAYNFSTGFWFSISISFPFLNLSIALVKHNHDNDECNIAYRKLNDTF